MTSKTAFGNDEPPIVHSKACVFEIRREAVRVKAKKVDGFLQPEYRRFSVDPQITTFEVLVALLARAFDIPTDFTISYVAHDSNANQDVYVSLLSDWDLDAAFLSSSHPHLRLKVDVKPFEPGLEDWDILSPLDVSALSKTQQSQQQWEFGEKRRANSNYPAGRRPSLDGFFGTTARISPSQMQNIVNDKLPNAFANFSSQVGKAFNSVSQAMRGDNLLGERLSETILSSDVRSLRPTKLPMVQAEFQNFLDSDGRMVKPLDFRKSVYHGGIDASLRRSLWPHLLNVYPENLTGQQRIDYMKRKIQAYGDLLNKWTNFNHDCDGDYTSEEVRSIMSMVQKDVLRTDRTHKFYSGSEENGNIVKLFNILVTYALNHPKVSYCQGMGDLASPILVVMGDEARSYVSFCGLMRRVDKNFMTDGIAMTTKFKHLALLLEHHDPVFSQYLKDEGAFDLFFCYRWLLLELKREFPFDEALMMLEIHWSSFYPSPPSTDLSLTDYGNVEAEVSVRPDDVTNAVTNAVEETSSSSSPSFPSTSRSTIQGESIMSKSVPPPRPPPPFSRQSSSFASGSSIQPQNHYTRLRDQVRQCPSGSTPFLRPVSPYLATKSSAKDPVSPDVSPLGDVQLPTSLMLASPEDASTVDTASEHRKPSIVSADGDFNVIFETSLTKTVAMTKTFLDKHFETLSGVTNTSILKTTRERRNSLKNILTKANSSKYPSGQSLDSVIRRTSLLSTTSSVNNPFVDIEPNEAERVEKSEIPSLFLDTEIPAADASQSNSNDGSMTNPFLTNEVELEKEDDESSSIINRSKEEDETENNNEEDSSETGGCDSTSNASCEMDDFNLEETKSEERVISIDSSSRSDSLSPFVVVGALPSATPSLPNDSLSDATTTMMKDSEHRLSLVTDPFELGIIRGGGTGDDTSSSYSNTDGSLGGGGEVMARHHSTDSNATWYCDPFLGHPEESSLKDVVTFLDSCESAHESVEASQEEKTTRSTDEEIQDGDGRGLVEGIERDITANGTRIDLDEVARNREMSSLSVVGSRTSTVSSFNEFDKNVMRSLENNLIVNDDPKTINGGAIPTPAATGPLLFDAASLHPPPPVRQRRSSSLSNDTPIPSLGSLTIDFVQVSNSETPSLEPLPLPEILGDGCPFLLFLCLTLLLQQRDVVLKRHFDCNEIAIHFDKMVRRHRVEGVLCQARHLYAEYLKRHRIKLQEDEIRQFEGENAKMNDNHQLATPSSVGDLGISV